MEQHTAIVPYGAAELRARVNDLRLSVMQQDIDFGKIPGVDKMVLLKPGAEKLCAEFGFYPRFEQVSVVENFDTSPPLFHYRYRAVLYRVATGEAIAEGIGSCNSMEKKYRYRQSERVCPHCGKAAIIKGKSEYGGGWVCFKRKDGCGAKFSDNDLSIVGQEVGQVDNPDIFDQVNTLDKMAQKRALIAAVLIATNASAYFTQDLEDDVIDGHYEEMRSEPPKQAATAPKQGKPASTGATVAESPEQATSDTPLREVLLTAVTVEKNETTGNRRMRFVTADNLQSVFSWTRQPFISGGWCDDRDWMEPNIYSLPAPAPAKVKWNATESGGYWTVESVDPFQPDFLTEGAL